jgi:biopolymer transport protein TolR
MSEINVTPFVDVMLVLLIIFMVTAPMMQQGVEVNLPKTTTQNIRLQDEPLVLSVKKDGTYFLGRREVPATELKDKLTAILEGIDRKEIFLRADKSVRYERVVQALAAARLAGATKIGMVTEPES